MGSFTSCNPYQILFKLSNQGGMRWAGHVARMEEKRNVYRGGLLMRKPKVTISFERPRRRCEGSISGVPRRVLGCSTPPTPEIPKALQNRAKLNPTVKTVKNC